MANEKNHSVQLLPEDGVTGMQLRKLRTLNRALQVTKSNSDPRQRIFTEIRCRLLQLTPKDLEAESGIHNRASQSMVLGAGQPQHETFSQFVRFIDSKIGSDNGMENGANGQVEHLRTARAELIKALVGGDKGTVLGLYRQWMYETGYKDFEGKTGLNYGRLWQRRAQGTIPEFGEIIDVARNLGKLTDAEKAEENGEQYPLAQHPSLQEAQEIWIKESVKMGRQKAIVEAHLAAQCSGFPISAEGLVALGLTHETARSVANYRPVRRKDIAKLEAIVQFQFGQKRADAWGKKWDAMLETVQNKGSFWGDLKKRMEINGYDNPMLVRWFGIKDTDPDMSRPSHVVRDVLDGRVSPYAPPAVFAHLVGVSKEDISALEERYKAERTEDRTRRGLFVTPLLLEAEQWQITAEDLGMNPELWKKYMEGTKNDERLVASVRGFGEEKAKLVLKKWMNEQMPLTVQMAASSLSAKFEGAAPFSRHFDGVRTQLQEAGQETPTACSHTRMLAIAAGKDVPEWPLLKSLVEAGGLQVSPYLLEDWRLQYAEQAGRETASPLVRGIRTLVAERDMSFKKFCDAHQLDSQFLVHKLRRIASGEQQGKWEELAPIMKAMGFADDSLQSSYIRALLEANQDEVKAMQQWRKIPGTDRTPKNASGILEVRATREHNFDKDFSQLSDLLAFKHALEKKSVPTPPLPPAEAPKAAKVKESKKAASSSAKSASKKPARVHPTVMLNGGKVLLESLTKKFVDEGITNLVKKEVDPATRAALEETVRQTLTEKGIGKDGRDTAQEVLFTSLDELFDLDEDED